MLMDKVEVVDQRGGVEKSVRSSVYKAIPRLSARALSLSRSSFWRQTNCCRSERIRAKSASGIDRLASFLCDLAPGPHQADTNRPLPGPSFAPPCLHFREVRLGAAEIAARCRYCAHGRAAGQRQTQQRRLKVVSRQPFAVGKQLGHAMEGRSSPSSVPAVLRAGRARHLPRGVRHSGRTGSCRPALARHAAGSSCRAAIPFPASAVRRIGDSRQCSGCFATAGFPAPFVLRPAPSEISQQEPTHPGVDVRFRKDRLQFQRPGEAAQRLVMALDFLQRQATGRVQLPEGRA